MDNFHDKTNELLAILKRKYVVEDIQLETDAFYYKEGYAIFVEGHFWGYERELWEDEKK